MKMVIDIILGNNIDTSEWIYDLKKNEAENIIVIDYDFNKDFEVRDGVTYMNPSYAYTYIKQIDSKNYYKSLYVFPGMSGNMSSLHRKSNN